MVELLILGAVFVFTIGFVMGNVLSIKQAEFEQRRDSKVEKYNDK